MKIITIELQDHEFDRMVFDSERNQDLIDQINQIVYDSKQIASVTTDEISVSRGLDEIQNNENPKRCSGWEGCNSGKIIEIIDGDTMRVDGGGNFQFYTSFALAFAPELDEDGGEDAKQFLEKICPIGSDVLVDQDHYQGLDRSLGMTSSIILAEIHCNGMNLNEALVESEHGYIGVGYCKNSEFRDKDWAINNGCPTYEEVRKWYQKN